MKKHKRHSFKTLRYAHNSNNWKRFVSAQVDAKTFGCRVKKLAEIPKMKTKLETTFHLTSLLLLFLSSVYAKTAAGRKTPAK